MSHKLLSIAAICATMMACNSNKTETAVSTSIELPGTVDNESFAANVESISVLNLEMDDAWTLANDVDFTLTDNYIYLLESNELRLMCFDRKTGERHSTRTLKGNGPGEINHFNSTFHIGDTLCIFGENNTIYQYDHNGAFLGKLHEFRDCGFISVVYRLNSGKYLLIMHNFSATDTIPPKVLLTDNKFNILSEHFRVPEIRASFYLMGLGKTYIANNDTLRFFFHNHCDNHLYSLFGDSEQCNELVLPNPLTAELMQESTNNPSLISKIMESDGFFGNLGESGRFVTFRYVINSKKQYVSLLDKRTNKVVSMCIEDEMKESAAVFTFKILIQAKTLLSDGKYLFTQCKNHDLSNILEGHDNLLDARLKQTQAEYRAYLERNAEYIKDLEPEERDAVTVLLKIKLND